jgi:hypothetical protein
MSNNDDLMERRVGDRDGEVFQLILRESRASSVVSFLERIVFQKNLHRLSSLSLKGDGAFADLNIKEESQERSEVKGKGVEEGHTSVVKAN